MTEPPAIAEPKPGPGLMTRLRRWTFGFLFLLLLAALAVRYVPTATYTGQVQRVYEKALEYRVEFVTSEGEVRVFNNRELRFPYLKFDTADLQANLEKLQRDGDMVRITVWGLRSAMFSAFPNVVDVERVQAGTARRDALQARLTAAVLAELRAMQLVPPGREAEVELRLRHAIELSSEAAPVGALR